MFIKINNKIYNTDHILNAYITSYITKWDRKIYLVILESEVVALGKNNAVGYIRGHKKTVAMFDGQNALENLQKAEAYLNDLLDKLNGGDQLG